MKRRSFLKGVVAAVALGVSPMLLNTTKLELAGVGQAYGAPAHRKTFRFGLGEVTGNISEVGIGYHRTVFDPPIVKTTDMVLDVVYEWRRGEQEPDANNIQITHVLGDGHRV